MPPLKLQDLGKEMITFAQNGIPAGGIQLEHLKPYAQAHHRSTPRRLAVPHSQ